MRGLGIDIVEVDRIQAAISKFGDRFLQKIYTKNELAYCEISKNHFRYKSLAAQFAAKEAFYKAAYPIIRQPISWQDCEVIHDEELAPTIRLHSVLNQKLQFPRVFLSLTHSKKYAAAVVVVE